MLQVDAQLNQVKAENDHAEMTHKKQLWRSIMAQKMGLKQIKTLNEKGQQLNSMNTYGEKLLKKKGRQDSLTNKI